MDVNDYNDKTCMTFVLSVEPKKTLDKVPLLRALKFRLTFVSISLLK